MKHLHLFVSKHPELHKALEDIKQGGQEGSSHSIPLEEHGSEAEHVAPSHDQGAVGGVKASKEEKGGKRPSDEGDDAYESILNKHKKKASMPKADEDCY